MQSDKAEMKRAALVKNNRPTTPNGSGISPLQAGIEKWYQEEWSPAPPGNRTSRTSKNCLALGAVVLLLVTALAALLNLGS